MIILSISVSLFTYSGVIILCIYISLLTYSGVLCESSKLLQLPYMTVSNNVNRFLQSGSAENNARSGRPKVVTVVKVNHSHSLGDITAKFFEVRWMNG